MHGPIHVAIPTSREYEGIGHVHPQLSRASLDLTEIALVPTLPDCVTEHFIGTNMPPEIKDIDIHAVWDGLQEHSVKVNINIKVHNFADFTTLANKAQIKSQPGTHSVLLDYIHESVEAASVTSIHELEGITNKRRIERESKHPSRLSGGPLKPLAAEYFPFQAMHTPQIPCSSRVYRDLTTSQRRRLFPNPRPVSTTTLQKLAQGEYFMQCRLLAQAGFNTEPLLSEAATDRFAVPDNDTAEWDTRIDQIQYSACGSSDDCPRSASGETIVIHSPLGALSIHGISDQECDERRQMTTEVEIPDITPCKVGTEEHQVPKICSAEPFCSLCNISGDNAAPKPPDHATKDSKELLPLSSKTKTTGVEEPCHSGCQDNFSLENRLPPRPEAFSPPMECRSSAHDPSAMKPNSMPMRPLVATSGNRLGVSTADSLPIFKHTSFTVGRVEGESFGKVHYDTNVSISGAQSGCRLSSVTSHLDAHHGINHLQREHGVDISSSTVESSDIDSCMVVAQEGRDSRNDLQSPPSSPRLWLRDRGSSSKYFLRNPITPLKDESRPIQVKQEGKICIYFPNNVKTGTYEIEVEASVYLSSPGSHEWQSLSIPGLPCLQNRRGDATTGSFSFVLKSPADEKDIPVLQFHSKELLDYEGGQSDKVIGRFRLSTPPRLLVRRKQHELTVQNFTTGVIVCITLSALEHGRIEFKYHVRMTFIVDDADIFADQIRFSLAVRHALLEDSMYRLEPGVHAVTLSQNLRLSSLQMDIDPTIDIVRSIQDLQEPLDIYFATTYNVSDSPTCPLLSLRPASGKVRSETILLIEPPLPLVVKHLPRGSFSAWEAFQYIRGKSRILRFDRGDIPPLFPEGLRDDVMVKVSELISVPFRALENTKRCSVNEDSVRVARDLQIEVYEVLGGNIECHISVDVQVGSSSKVLVINPGCWDPQYSLINGKLATQKAGEWRVTRDGFLTLLRTPSMTLSQVIPVEFHFQQNLLARNDEEDDPGQDVQEDRLEEVFDSLPKVVGKTVLGGLASCDLERCKILPNHPFEAVINSHSLIGALTLVDAPHTGNGALTRRCRSRKIRLPRLTPDYALVMKYTRVHKAPESGHLQPGKITMPLEVNGCEHNAVRPRGPRTVRFVDEQWGDAVGTIPSAHDEETDAELSAPSDFELLAPPTAYRKERIGFIMWLFHPFKMIIQLLWRAAPGLLYIVLCGLIVRFLLSAFPEDYISEISLYESNFNFNTAIHAEAANTSDDRLHYTLEQPLGAPGRGGEGARETAILSGNDSPASYETEIMANPNGYAYQVESGSESETHKYERLTVEGVGLRDRIDYALGWRGYGR
ncbi:hypothetical protein MMC24_007844, partial [Lignoscripta atroalba]|nr:hypothetical protein [Lignoscripta atroalba]